MNYSIHSCTPALFDTLKNYISQFELDNRSLQPSQFLVALENETVLGFGRIREHADCSELCSLGVIEPKRHKGIGRALTRALITKAKQPLYLVCIIPHFFEPPGFSVTDKYPTALQNKLDYCTNELVVPEEYVVMKYNKH
jgi:N-acetylglutamate synthase-like GNAT family acetyltransferase